MPIRKVVAVIKRLIIQLLIFLIGVVLERIIIVLQTPLTTKRHSRHLAWFWACLLILLSWWNFGWYYFCYFLIVWMLAAIVLVGGQHHHYSELLYRRYWPVFWRLTFVLAALAYLASWALQDLPEP
ncbi:hypothetical protein [Limosilactobacillus difficilis]|uniref:hypothetical protein n=1 Tax=Limosilactobacillus difficilis TaxID=2991838 RepID=UPI0024B8C2B9|nr:hypothetical protein [Limosilactobacillus difficilis]